MYTLTTTGDTSMKFEENQEYIQETISYLGIMAESPMSKIEDLYINIPIAQLDFKDLFIDQCPHIESI
jgi:hypothetical protein